VHLYDRNCKSTNTNYYSCFWDNLNHIKELGKKELCDSIITTAEPSDDRY